MNGSLERDFLALLIHQGFSHHAKACEGVFAEAGRRKFPQHIIPVKNAEAPILHSRHCVGVIGFLESAESHEVARKLPVPAINLSNTRGPCEGVGNILSDDLEVGRAAARHLLSRGHRCLVGVGLAGKKWSEIRLNGFVEEGRAGGAEIHVVDFPEVEDAKEMPDWSPVDFMTPRAEALRPILSGFPPEAGIFGANDHLASMIQHSLFADFPERMHTMGLLGAGNSRSRSYTPGELRGISSVRVAFYELGEHALAWFVDHPGERKAAALEVYEFIAPRGVEVRASTAGAACGHPNLARGMRWAWERIREGRAPTVKALADSLNMSTRSLERLCRAHIGTNARDYLLSMRMDYARQLLKEAPELSVGRIGERCGFRKAGHFSAMFRAHTGHTPLRFRNETVS